jgi:hypothetical protein
MVAAITGRSFTWLKGDPPSHQITEAVHHSQQGLHDFDDAAMPSSFSEDARIVALDASSYKEVSVSADKVDAAINGRVGASPRGVEQTHAARIRSGNITPLVCATCGFSVEGDAYCASGKSVPPLQTTIPTARASSRVRLCVSS